MSDGFARRHVRSLAAALSVVSIGLVVAAVRGFVPASALPQAPDAVLAAIPTANAALSAAAIAAIATGWRAIRDGNVRRHRAAMTASTLLFGTFLALYLYRIVVAGTTHFAGPDAVYTFVYLPVLVVHMGLAMVCIPLVYYALLLAATRDVSEIPATSHATVGRVAASLWLVSFTLGIVVYLLLYVAY
jgi:putative membrane protein